MKETPSIIIVAKSTIPPEFLENIDEQQMVYLITGKQATIPVSILSMMQKHQIDINLIEYEMPQILYTIFDCIASADGVYELRTNDDKIIKTLDIKDTVTFKNNTVLKIGKPVKKTTSRKTQSKKPTKETETVTPTQEPIQTKEEQIVEDKDTMSGIDQKQTVVPKQTRRKKNTTTSKNKLTPETQTLLKQATGESADPILDTIIKCIRQATDDESGLEFQLKIHMASFGYNVTACQKLAEKIKPIFEQIKCELTS